MRLALAAAIAALTGGSVQAAAVEIDAVARVIVIPQARDDVEVVVARPNAALPLVVRNAKGRIRVESAVNRKIRDCRIEDGRPVVHLLGLGDVGWRDLPQLIIRTPRDVDVGAGGAVFGVIGRAASVNLANAGCGDWTVANVAGPLRISQAGAGDTRAGSAGSAKLRLAGSGDIATAAIRGGARIEMAGSGDVTLAAVAGPLDIRMAGSGDVAVAGGRASPMTVSAAGSGNVTFRGVADALRARVTGSGDVRVGAVSGEIRRSVIGSGTVTVGAPEQPPKAAN